MLQEELQRSVPPPEEENMLLLLLLMVLQEAQGAGECGGLRVEVEQQEDGDPGAETSLDPYISQRHKLRFCSD